MTIIPSIPHFPKNPKKNFSPCTQLSAQPSADAVYLFSEAGKLAYADRDQYLADTDFVPLPSGTWHSLLDKKYLARRAEQIATTGMSKAKAGHPTGSQLAHNMSFSPEFPSTTQIVVIDSQGQALTMTSSIEDQFGSRQRVKGFLLNNQ
ncbi:hypothetical protein ACTFIZ_000190 [Dictyostelium cf. discoideum]